jgi:hypothetical protein
VALPLSLLQPAPLLLLLALRVWWQRCSRQRCAGQPCWCWLLLARLIQ